MSIQMTQIGCINKGIDGTDRYVLLVDNEDDLSLERAYEFISEQYFCDGTWNGYFCVSAKVQQVQYSTNQVIAIVEHRLDN